MFNNRGGRMRELSIYSILTIIVLISISVGIASPQTVSEKAPPSGECLLVTASMIKLGSGNEGYESYWNKETTEEIRLSQTWVKQPTLESIALDGKKILRDEHGNFRKWVEFSPGHHTLAYVSMEDDDRSESARSNFVREFDAARQDVYAVYVGKAMMHGRLEGSGISVLTPLTYMTVVKTKLRYDSSTGAVTHPTDSKLSFKVK